MRDVRSPGEYRARRSRDFENDLVGCQPIAVAGAPVKFDVGIEVVEGSLLPRDGRRVCRRLIAGDDAGPWTLCVAGRAVP